MNLEPLLHFVQINSEPVEFLLQPFALAVIASHIPKGQYLPLGTPRCLCWLQYDGINTKDRHKCVQQSNWRKEADYVFVIHQGQRIYVPLAMAVPNTKEDVRVDMRFADGHLWGWFPKPQPEPVLEPKRDGFDEWFAAREVTPSLYESWVAGIEWARSHASRPFVKRDQ